MTQKQSSFVVLALILTASLSGCAEFRKLVSLFSTQGHQTYGNESQIEEISSGTDFSCALLGNRQVRCIGSGEKGNLGTFYTTELSSLKDPKQVASGKGFTCVISGEHSGVHCFGQNQFGQLGNPVVHSSAEPVPVLDSENNNSPLTEAVQITAGENHACAVLKNGRALCWGDNEKGQLGSPTRGVIGARSVMENDRASKIFTGIHSISAGGNGTCIIAKIDQFVYCFGERYRDQSRYPWMPQKIELFINNTPLTQAKQVSMGLGFGCALVRSQVFCWGLNDHKQLGAKTSDVGNPRAIPVEVKYPSRSILSKIEMIAAGDKHACALHRDEGTVYCWGNNAFGQLGTTSTHGAPEQVAVTASNLTLRRAKSLYAGKERTCIISSNDELFCWGNGSQGVIGSEIAMTFFPEKVVSKDGKTQTFQSSFSIGFDHSCGITPQNKISCFGLNQYGQMGPSTFAGPVLTFTGRTPVTDVRSMDSFGYRTCLVHGTNRELSCFGGKNEESVNFKKNQNNFTLEEVLTAESSKYQNVVAVTDGRLSLCLIQPSQTVECIDFKTRPPNHFFAENSPKTKIQDIWMVKTNGDFYCGLTREKGEIWCWGEWKSMNLPAAQHVKVNGANTSNFMQIVVNEDQLCGVSGSTGAVYCSVINENQPSMNLEPLLDQSGKQLSGVFSLTNGKNHVCGVGEKGKMSCWGSNEYGQLGNKTIKTNSTKAVRVELNPELEPKISKISAGTHHTCLSIFNEPALRCFGKSFHGVAASAQIREYPL